LQELKCLADARDGSSPTRLETQPEQIRFHLRPLRVRLLFLEHNLGFAQRTTDGLGVVELWVEHELPAVDGVQRQERDEAFETDVGLSEKLAGELPVEKFQPATNGVDLAQAREITAERTEVDLYRPFVHEPIGLDQRLLERLVSGDGYPLELECLGVDPEECPSPDILAHGEVDPGNLDCRLLGELDSFPKDAACEHPTMVGGTELDKSVNEIRPQQKRLVPSEVGVEEHVHRCPVGLDELLDCCCVDRHGFLFARARGA
jgi:hypothetical protein